MLNFYSSSFFEKDNIARQDKPIPSIPNPEFTSSSFKTDRTTTPTPIASATAFIIIGILVW